MRTREDKEAQGHNEQLLDFPFDKYLIEITIGIVNLGTKNEKNKWDRIMMTKNNHRVNKSTGKLNNRWHFVRVVNMILLISIIGYFSDVVNAEMPLEPNLEELCENSGLIICGEPNEWIQIEDTVDVIAFKVHKVYKGQTNQKCVNIIIPKVNKGKTKLILSIKGIKSTYMTMGCSVIPIYVKDKKYFLFLDQKKTGSCYVRAKIDDLWGQRDWDKEQEQQLSDEIKFLSDPNKWKNIGDNINYSIPEGAEEKIVTLTEYQKENNFSKRAEYWLNGKLVGERAWYGNGQIAYEQPIKDNMQHGNYTAWYQDGKLRAVCPYRKDRLHGVFQQWNNKGHLEITYYIRGKNVTRKEYLKELKNNATLPLIKK